MNTLHGSSPQLRSRFGILPPMPTSHMPKARTKGEHCLTQMTNFRETWSGQERNEIHQLPPMISSLGEREPSSLGDSYHQELVIKADSSDDLQDISNLPPIVFIPRPLCLRLPHMLHSQVLPIPVSSWRQSHGYSSCGLNQPWWFVGETTNTSYVWLGEELMPRARAG